MTIENKKVVSVSYSLSSPDKASGKEEFVEKADKTSPLVWLYGTGSMIPDFETNLKGKKKGDSFDFHIKAENAYGLHDVNFIIDIPLDAFRGADGAIEPGLLEKGNILPMTDNQGNQMQGKVVEVSIASAKLDFNHPMAGKDLHFTGEVVEVRDASAEEIAHGHVHGPGGHHH